VFAKHVSLGHSQDTRSDGIIFESREKKRKTLGCTIKRLKSCEARIPFASQ